MVDSIEYEKTLHKVKGGIPITRDALIKKIEYALWFVIIDKSKDGLQYFLIDSSTAEPDVNWPGELISEHTTYNDARKALAEHILKLCESHKNLLN